MRFNSPAIIELAMKEGDQEGRMFHKSPSKSLYESANKERWFKLKGNLLFYYRLNEEGVVERNEPNGVFVLENVTVEREKKNMKLHHGFTLTWKDDPDRRHYFYTSSEILLQTWITKLKKASYENLRAKMLVLRQKILQKTGKDPMAHLGMPLPVRRGMLASHLKGEACSNRHFGLSSSSSDSGLAAYAEVGKEIRKTYSTNVAKSAPTSPSVSVKICPTNSNPVPPPRTNRDRKRNAKGVRKKKPSHGDASFKSHISDSSKLGDCTTFKSHVNP